MGQALAQGSGSFTTVPQTPWTPAVPALTQCSCCKRNTPCLVEKLTCEAGRSRQLQPLGPALHEAVYEGQHWVWFRFHMQTPWPCTEHA